MAHPLSECLTMAWVVNTTEAQRLEICRGFPSGHRDIQGAKVDPHRYLRPPHALPHRVVQLPTSCQISMLWRLRSWARSKHPIPSTWASTNNTQENPQRALCLRAWTGSVSRSGMNGWGIFLLRCRLRIAVYMTSHAAASRRSDQLLLCSVSLVLPLPDSNLLPHPVRIEGSYGHRVGQEGG